MKKEFTTFKLIERIENHTLLANGTHRVEIKLNNGNRWIGTLNENQYRAACYIELLHEIENTPTERSLK